MDTEDGRWMTKAEIASVRRITVASADRLIRRHGWRKQLGNDGRARVLVPPSWAQPDDLAGLAAYLEKGGVKPPLVLSVLEAAITTLSEQLGRERERADRFEAETTALRQADTERRTRGLLARLLAALRGL